MTTFINKSLSHHTKESDLVHLIGEKEKSFIIQLEADATLQTHLGIIPHNELIGAVWGSRVRSHTGKSFLILQPALDDLIRDIPRETQVMYPKDIGYVIMNLGIGPGTKVIEAGSGSGALTTILAYLVGDTGKVFSYEKKIKHSKIAAKNIEKFGLSERVDFIHHDITDGFNEHDAQAIFLDIPQSHLYIKQAHKALIPGGFFGSIVPTTNNVSELITALKKNNFSLIEVSEILHRYYKPSATRLRPVDRMVAHTGFLVFARRLTSVDESNAQQ